MEHACQQRSSVRKQRGPRRATAVPAWRRRLYDGLWLLACVLVVALLRAFVFGAYVIPSASMEGTLNIGDRVIASKIKPKVSGVQRGDIVIFHDPAHWLNTGPHDDFLIKRVIGVGGDRVS
ncbi:signal peptidase I, partial [Bifidobacterium aemilianum]